MIDQGGCLVLETICVAHHLIHLRRGITGVWRSLAHVDTQVMIMMSQPPSHCLQVNTSPPWTLNTEQEPSLTSLGDFLPLDSLTDTEERIKATPG